MAGRGIARGVVEGGPGVAGGDIKGGVLPGAPAGPGQLADMETVQLHQVARLRRLDVADGLRDPRPRLGRGLVARDQPQPLGARIEAGAAEDVPDAVRAASVPAPPRAPQLHRQPVRPPPGMGQGQRQDVLFQPGRRPSRRLRRAALPRGRNASRPHRSTGLRQR